MDATPHTRFQPAPAGAAPVDAACLAACLAGEPKAIERLYRAYAPMVHGLVGRLAGPTPDLEDLVQTTFLEVLEHLDAFRGEAQLSTWICGIAVHVVQHHLRAGKVRRHVPLELVPEGVRQLTAPREDREGSIDDRRLAARLHALLDRLHPRKRVALLLHVVEGCSVEEIAALTRSTQTTVRSRTFFARRELRRLIAKDAALSEWANAHLGRPVGGTP